MTAPGDQLSPKPSQAVPKAAETPAEDDLAAVLRNWDVLFLGLVAALVAILASSPITNSAIFRHLATGRALLQGDYWFGDDPFSYAAGGYWFNPSWLFDVLTFGLFSMGGGWGLTGLKVFLAVGTLAALVQIAVPKKTLWLATLCPALAALILLSLVHDVSQQPLLPLLKVALLFVPIALAGTISNWRNSSQLPLAIAGLMLSLGGAFWLYQDIGLLSGLVLAKLFAIVLLAQLWLRQQPADQQLWWTALALLAAAVASMPSMELRPVFLSGFFLALTLLLVQRGALHLQKIDQAEKKGSGVFFAQHPPGLWGKRLPTPFSKSFLLASLNAFWPVLVVFFLWVNLDTWFLLGLVLIPLAGLGLLTAGDRKNARLAAHLGLLLLGSCLVCVVNPQHILVFRLPAELDSAIAWDPGFFGNANRPQPAAIALLILFVLSVFSFLVNFPRWSLPRLVLWAAVFLLGLTHTSLIPFFAVIAVPVVALNMNEYARRRFAGMDAIKGTARGWVVVARPLGVLAASSAVVAAWPGLLQGDFSGPPFWAIERDPHLQASVQSLHAWPGQNRGEGSPRGFNVSPQFGDYLAWFCPNRKCFVNSRGFSDPQAASDYQMVEKVLFGPAPISLPQGEDVLSRLRRVLRKWNANYLVLHDSDVDRLSEAASRLWRHRDEWPLVHLQGRTAIFAWRDKLRPKAKNPVADLQIDLQRTAFFPEQPVKLERKGPFPDRFWWLRFLRSVPPPSAKRAEAELLIRLFGTYQEQYWKDSRLCWEQSQAAGRVGDGAAMDCLSRVVADYLRQDNIYENVSWDTFQLARDDGPLPYLYLAVRAARQAIGENPFDAETHLTLGKAYLTLSRSTRERAWAGRAGRLARLQTIQSIAALAQAVSLDPSLGEAHQLLSGLYQDMFHVDWALEHQEKYENCLRQKGRLPTESSAAYRLRLDEATNETRRLKARVDFLLREYDKAASATVVKMRVKTALKFGLGKKALELLLNSDISVFGKEGAQLQLQLLLDAGRLGHVHELLATPKLDNLIGTKSYHWLHTQLAAALGDYPTALRHLAKVASAPGNGGDISQFQRDIAMDLASSVLLARAASPPTLPPSPLFDRLDSEMRIQQLLHDRLLILRALADWTVLHGLLAFEAGETQKAEYRFRQALTVWQNQRGQTTATALDFGLRPAAEQMLQMFEKYRSK